MNGKILRKYKTKNKRLIVEDGTINNKVVLIYMKNEMTSEMQSWIKAVVHQDHSVFLPFSYPNYLYYSL